MHVFLFATAITVQAKLLITIYAVINKWRDVQKRRRKKKERELQKCVDKHTTEPSIIYLVLFIEFPVCAAFVQLTLSHVIEDEYEENVSHAHGHSGTKSSLMMKYNRAADIRRDRTTETIGDFPGRSAAISWVSSRVCVVVFAVDRIGNHLT